MKLAILKSVSIRLLGCLCLSVSLSFSLTGCGGNGSSAGTAPVNPTPQTPEYLFATGQQGLEVLNINLNTGVPTTIQTIAAGGNPYSGPTNQVVASSSGKYLYVIDVSVAQIDAYTVAADGTLSVTKGSPYPVSFGTSGLLPSAGVNALAVTPNGAFLYALNGLNGVGIEYQVDPATGALTVVPGSFPPPQSKSWGSGWRSAIVSPDNKFLYVTDWYTTYFDPHQGQMPGLDAFAIDPTSGSLSPTPNSPFILPWDSQPWQTVIDPAGHFTFTPFIGDANLNPLWGFSRNLTTGDLTKVPGSPFASGPSASTETHYLAIHPSGKFLYAFSDFDQSISAFAIDSSTGVLTQVPGSPYASQTAVLPAQLGPPAVPFETGPLIVDPSGNFLYVAGNEGAMAIFKVNRSSGALSVADSSPAMLPDRFFYFATTTAP